MLNYLTKHEYNDRIKVYISILIQYTQNFNKQIENILQNKKQNIMKGLFSLKKVCIAGATGMVGQRFLTLLNNHPWFDVVALAASGRSSGKTYEEAVGGRWFMSEPIPEKYKNIVVLDAVEDAEKIADMCDTVFCAVTLSKEETKELEERYAKLEMVVISNNSAHRKTPDVPMIIPEVNPGHTDIIPYQRKRLGTSRGFIAVKSNCSLQSYVPALTPLMDLGLTNVLACTYQAISGAGKNFEQWPEMVDNVIPFIGGEEEKSEQEPLKIWGKIANGVIQPAVYPSITTQCIRVPVTDGHLAAAFVSFDKKIGKDEIIERWNNFEGEPQRLKLPLAPQKFLHYFTEDDRPQTKLDRNLEKGMAVSIGRLRPDSQFDFKFISLSHNTLRGAAGGGVLMAELLHAKGYLDS